LPALKKSPFFKVLTEFVEVTFNFTAIFPSGKYPPASQLLGLKKAPGNFIYPLDKIKKINIFW